MVGIRLFPFWDGLFAGAMLVSGRVTGYVWTTVLHKVNEVVGKRIITWDVFFPSVAVANLTIASQVLGGFGSHPWMVTVSLVPANWGRLCLRTILDLKNMCILQLKTGVPAYQQERVRWQQHGLHINVCDKSCSSLPAWFSMVCT